MKRLSVMQWWFLRVTHVPLRRYPLIILRGLLMRIPVCEVSPKARQAPVNYNDLPWMKTDPDVESRLDAYLRSVGFREES